MAYISRKVSDISGQEINPDEEILVVVREHPAIESPVQIDATVAEVNAIKTAGEVVQLELKFPGDTVPRTVIVDLKEFQKHVSDESVKNARSTRGRRPGFSPNGSR